MGWGFLSFKIIVILIILSPFQACVYQKETVCDTLNLSYQNDIQPILVNNCYICHSSANYISSGSNVNLEGYSNVKSQLDQGYIIPNIKHINVPGKTIDFMPKNASMLPACDIEQIQAWYNAGAPNN